MPGLATAPCIPSYGESPQEGFDSGATRTATQRVGFVDRAASLGCMPEYPIVVRELGGENRLGVEDADDFEGDLRDVVVEGYDRVAVPEYEDGDRVGTVVAASTTEIETVRWTTD